MILANNETWDNLAEGMKPWIVRNGLPRTGMFIHGVEVVKDNNVSGVVIDSARHEKSEKERVEYLIGRLLGEGR